MRLRALITTACVTMAAASTAQEVGLPVQEHRLDNGLRLLLVERPGTTTVSCGWVVRAGSVNDPAGATGTAHLFEHVLFKGSRTIGTLDWRREAELLERIDTVQTDMAAENDRLREARRRGAIAGDLSLPENRTPRLSELGEQLASLQAAHHELMVPDEYDRIFADNGAPAANAFTGHDLTAFFITVPASRLELWFWMESDRLLAPVFREFYAERDVVREERRLIVESDPTAPALELYDAMFWASMPYHHPVIGWASEVESIDRDQARTFFATHFVPDNITAVLVGDFESRRALELAERYLGRIPRSPAPPPIVSQPALEPATRRLEAVADTPPSVLIRWPGVPFVHRDVYALDVLSDLLNDRSGRLYRSLVEEQGLISGEPYAVNQPMSLAGLFEVGVEVADGNCHRKVEAALLEEIERLRTEPVDPRELQRIKNASLADSLRSLRSSDEVLVQLLLSEGLGDWRYVTEGPQRLQAVTVDDILRVAATYLDPGRTSVLWLDRDTPGECEHGRLDEPEPVIGEHTP